MKYAKKRRYSRKSKRRGIRRSYGRKNKFNKLGKAVRRIIQASAEKKWVSIPATPTIAPETDIVAAEGYVALSGIIPIAQGVGRSQRVGNRINVRSMWIRGQLLWDQFIVEPQTGYHCKIFECRPLRGQTGFGGVDFQANLLLWFNNANNFARTYASHKVDNQQAGFFIARTWTFTQPMINSGVTGYMNGIGNQHFTLNLKKGKKGFDMLYAQDAATLPYWYPVYIVMNGSTVNQMSITYEARTVYTDV